MSSKEMVMGRDGTVLLLLGSVIIATGFVLAFRKKEVLAVG